MYEFERMTNGFNYIFESDIENGEEMIVKMPRVSANKRGINDIGWQSDGDIYLYGTLARRPASTNAMWQEITPGDEINKTVSAIKIINAGHQKCRVVIRVILN